MTKKVILNWKLEKIRWPNHAETVTPDQVFKIINNDPARKKNIFKISIPNIYSKLDVTLVFALRVKFFIEGSKNNINAVMRIK